jgi:hypothetical protein
MALQYSGFIAMRLVGQASWPVVLVLVVPLGLWGQAPVACNNTPAYSPCELVLIRAANVHHWAYTEKNAAGLDQAHLWMGATEVRFALARCENSCSP